MAIVCLIWLAGCSTAAQAAQRHGLPETAARTYAENYKDMMLALCFATAYKNVPNVLEAAENAASALHEWTRFDEERATGVNVKLIDRYLARTYHAKEGSKIDLSILKCIDMRHSAELEAQVQQYVDKPTATYVTDQQEE